VGTTMTWPLIPPLPSLHPHTRGDHRVVAGASHQLAGSPPHAWGPLSWEAAGAAMIRFTPTRVGTTGLPIVAANRFAVHPHTRGDHRSTRDSMASAFGSPPHAWGPQRRRHVCYQPIRFTPTRVGTTWSGTSATWATPVHPHTRGDHAFRRLRDLYFHGSPPHAWGPRSCRPLGPTRPRFTPTRVGTTRFGRHPGRQQAVHPHTRGDHARGQHHEQESSGSPPHAWGPRRVRLLGRRARRFTPTRVGTTRPRRRRLPT